MFFWNSLAFLMIQRMLAIWSLVSLPFLNPAWTSGISLFTYCWSLAWRILSITLLVWDECNCAVVWAFFGIAFLWDWKENWPFPVPWPLLNFPNLLLCWVQHFHSIIWHYSLWNSPGQNTGVGSLSLLQGIFQIQGSNPGLPHCRWILYQLSHKGSLW